MVKPTTPKSKSVAEIKRTPRRPIRAKKQNRLFIDSSMWNNATSSRSSKSVAVSLNESTTEGDILVPRIILMKENRRKCTDLSVQALPLSPMSINSDKQPSLRMSPLLVTGRRPDIPRHSSIRTVDEIPARSVQAVGNEKKRKNFIRFRFQIDCVAAIDVNVDELVQYLKDNMKVDGRKQNLEGVQIERRNSNVDILSKVMVKKKYFKLLCKKYLKTKKMHHRVLAKNTRAYKIVAK